VCFWEDDPVQLLDPWYVGGTNKVSLQQAQENFSRFGVSEQRFAKDVKGVLAGDMRDPRWRPVSEADRKYVTTPATLAKEKSNGDWPWYCKKQNVESANLKLHAQAGYLLVPTFITVISAIRASHISVVSFVKPRR